MVSKVHKRFARFKMVIFYLRLKSVLLNYKLIICVTYIEGVNEFSIRAFGLFLSRSTFAPLT